MKLRGKEFGNVFCASGARNFFPVEGWNYHKQLRRFGLVYTGSTPIYKTTTIDQRDGNMPLQADSTQPVERLPKCIVVKPLDAAVLNSVGLSGPGTEWLLKQNKWQKNKDPAVISFMAVGQTHEERLDEYRRFVELMLPALADFQGPIAIEVNISCPNARLNLKELIKEVHQYLNILSALNVPIIVKINALMKQSDATEIVLHDSCDALDVSNTIPFGELPNRIPWKKYFGEKSPLAHLGGGGYSGKDLLPIVANWIDSFRQSYGSNILIIGGGGILCCDDADVMLKAGATAISLGCVSMLRPWRVQGIIKHVNARILASSIHASFGMHDPYRIEGR
jgi:dihydroorotate dehydrogenase